MNQIPIFSDPLTQGAYEKYCTILQAKEWGSDASPESMAAAIAFLGAVADYYLNSQDGDFIRITQSDQYER